ncbi:hypothetical protein [Streptomyces sp. NPDC101776]|uniref:hypothetical protein n=1 Tax=Streptomyces sp. NPDC101776 TaxID=3366146 RepID=UPI0037FDD672
MVAVLDLRGVAATVVAGAGAGITVLPRCLYPAEPASGAPLPLLVPEDPPINTSHLIRRPGPGLTGQPARHARTGAAATGRAHLVSPHMWRTHMWRAHPRNEPARPDPNP